MKKLLIGLCGEKGAGKDISASMLQYIIGNFNYNNYNISNATFEEDIPFDKDDEIPVIHHFANPLKDIISIIFGVPRKDLDNRDKKDKLYFNCKNLNYKKDDEICMIDVYIDEFQLKDLSRPVFTFWYKHLMEDDNTYIKLRTLLQFIGTDIFHNVFSPHIWINATLRKCNSQDIIADVRFPLEAQEIFHNNGKIIQIINTKHHYKEKDIHVSENQISCIKGDYSITWDGDNKEDLFNQLLTITKNIYETIR